MTTANLVFLRHQLCDSTMASSSSSPSGLDEDKVEKAVGFLLHPSVRGSAEESKRAFLLKKGLSQDEIEEAFLRTASAASGTGDDNCATTTTATTTYVAPFAPLWVGIERRQADLRVGLHGRDHGDQRGQSTGADGGLQFLVNRSGCHDDDGARRGAHAPARGGSHEARFQATRSHWTTTTDLGMEMGCGSVELEFNSRSRAGRKKHGAAVEGFHSPTERGK